MTKVGGAWATEGARRGPGLSWAKMRTTTLPLTGARGAAPPPLDPQVDLLEGQLRTALPHWHRARLNGLAKALLALIVASSVNLTKVARAYAGRAQVASHYRRLQRERLANLTITHKFLHRP